MSETSVPAFHVMAKPTGARCNLRCDYCFFLEKEDLYPGSDFRMRDEVMEAYIAQTAQAQRVPQVTLAWQGGEPTLMGLDFFRRARAAEAGRVPAGMAVERTLQTNGVLLDDEWCAFLAENDYLVGLSIDGPRELHDAYRHDAGGRPVFDKVVAAARRLQKHGAEFNVLCTINAANAGHPLEVYRFFRDELGARYVQLIPIVEVETPPAGGRPGTVTARSVQPDDYGRFLTAIFDEWVRRDVGEMFVQFFDGVLAAYVRGVSSLCILQPTCGEGVALEHNGDLYSCDHFVDPHICSATSCETPVGELVRSERQRAFGQAKQETLPAFCRACDVPLRLQRRVPQEPHPRDARRRARPQLALRRAQGVLRPHGPAHAPDGGHPHARRRGSARSWTSSPPRPAAPVATTRAPAAAARSTSAAAAL